MGDDVLGIRAGLCFEVSGDEGVVAAGGVQSSRVVVGHAADGERAADPDRVESPRSAGAAVVSPGDVRDGERTSGAFAHDGGEPGGMLIEPAAECIVQRVMRVAPEGDVISDLSVESSQAGVPVCPYLVAVGVVDFGGVGVGTEDDGVGGLVDPVKEGVGMVNLDAPPADAGRSMVRGDL